MDEGPLTKLSRVKMLASHTGPEPSELKVLNDCLSSSALN